MPHFLCKLKPPRPTFLTDMTPEEALVMRGHREYWMPRVEIGVVIAMGPVADPLAATASRSSRRLRSRRSKRCRRRIRRSRPGAASPTKICSMPTIAVRPSMPLAPIHSVTP